MAERIRVEEVVECGAKLRFSAHREEELEHRKRVVLRYGVVGEDAPELGAMFEELLLRDALELGEDLELPTS